MPRRRGTNGETRTKCLCPTCGKTHYRNRNYIGRPPARYYCKACRLDRTRFSGGMDEINIKLDRMLWGE